MKLSKTFKDIVVGVAIAAVVLPAGVELGKAYNSYADALGQAIDKGYQHSHPALAHDKF